MRPAAGNTFDEGELIVLDRLVKCALTGQLFPQPMATSRSFVSVARKVLKMKQRVALVKAGKAAPNDDDQPVEE